MDRIEEVILDVLRNSTLCNLLEFIVEKLVEENFRFVDRGAFERTLQRHQSMHSFVM